MSPGLNFCQTRTWVKGIVLIALLAVANISLTVAGFLSGAKTITADFVMSRAATVCAAVGPTVSGQSQVHALVINGQDVALTGAANQIVFLSDGGFVIINEQIAGVGVITVNALHLKGRGLPADFYPPAMPAKGWVLILVGGDPAIGPSFRSGFEPGSLPG